MISVITTVHNGDKYFDRAVPGILGQTSHDFEWVIVDDGSTDNTGAELDSIANQDLRLRILHPGRIGRTAALNLAVEAACGEYIANQDFDDVSSPGRLAAQAALLQARPEVALVGGYYVLRDSIRDERYVKMPPTSHEQIVRYLGKGIPFAHTTVMFRKQAWRDIGGYPLVDDLEDYLLCTKFVSTGWKLAGLPIILGEHWVHSESYWHTMYRQSSRQRDLAKLQCLTIRRLGLPLYLYGPTLGRLVYSYLPSAVRTWCRRVLGGLREKDMRNPKKSYG